jgi:dUTP pyrophosphatase
MTLKTVLECADCGLKSNRLTGAKFEVVKQEKRKLPGEIVRLPIRKSIDSAGYDFFLLETKTLQPKELHKFWTDIKIKLPPGTSLELLIRSSLGDDLEIPNKVGLIDRDYYDNPDNDGNICFKIRNVSDRPITLKKGERIGQGVIRKFYIVEDDQVTDKRMGGLGSTGK